MIKLDFDPSLNILLIKLDKFSQYPITPFVLQLLSLLVREERRIESDTVSHQLAILM